MSLREKAVKGVAWSAVEKWGTQGITFLVFLVLARLLEPDAFGLVTLAFVFTEFVQLFLDQGMAQAVIQFPRLERDHLDTAFWTSLLAGCLMAIGGWFLSDFVASLFKEPKLGPVIAWLSLSFILFALSSTQQAILQRNLNFKELATRSLIARVSGGVIGIGAALLGYGVWSLVAQNLVNGLVGTIVLWQVSDWRPSLSFSKKSFGELFNFGLSTMGVRILNFFDLRFDDLLIGYFLGTTALGYYAVAYRLLRTVINILTGITTTVAFPAFSRLQEDIDRLREAFYKITHFTSLMVWPAFLGMVILAPELIITLYGPTWEAIIVVMQLLAFGGIPFSTVQFSGSLAWALGKPKLVFSIRLIITLARIIAFTLAVQWGIEAVATAYVVINYGVFTPLYVWAAYQLIQVDFKMYFRQYSVPVVGSLVMVVVVLILKYIFGDWADASVQLVSYIFLGGGVYLLTLKLIKPMIFSQLLDLIRPILPSWKLLNIK